MTISRLEALANLRQTLKPLEEKDGGDCDIWLIKWPTTVKPQSICWVEARPSGVVPLHMESVIYTKGKGVYDAIQRAKANFKVEVQG